MKRVVQVVLASLVIGSCGASLASAVDWTTLPLGTAADVLVIQNTSFTPYLGGTGGFVAHANATRTVWTPVTIGTSADILSIVEPAATQVWISGRSGMVRVLEGTWQVRDIPNSQDFALYTRNSQRAMAVGSAGSIYRSDDRGMSWYSRRLADGVALHAGFGYVDATSVVVGDHGTVLRTTDGGAHWTQIPSGTTANLNGLIEAASNLVAVGASGTILTSPDNGLTWIPRFSGVGATLNAVSQDPSNPNYVVAVGNGGTVVKSSDFGAHWCVLSSGTATNLYALDTFSWQEYYAGGAGGLLLRTTDGGGTCSAASGVESLPAGAGVAPGGAGFVLRGPDPSPTAGEARFALTAGRDETVAIDVVDATGRLVAHLFDGRMMGGEERSFALDGQDWPAGVYFVDVHGAGGMAAKRVVITH